MTTQSRAILKSFFEKGDRPTQQNFIDVFERISNPPDFSSESTWPRLFVKICFVELFFKNN